MQWDNKKLWVCNKSFILNHFEHSGSLSSKLKIMFQMLKTVSCSKQQALHSGVHFVKFHSQNGLNWNALHAFGKMTVIAICLCMLHEFPLQILFLGILSAINVHTISNMSSASKGSARCCSC